MMYQKNTHDFNGWIFAQRLYKEYQNLVRVRKCHNVRHLKLELAYRRRWRVLSQVDVHWGSWKLIGITVSIQSYLNF